MKAVNRPLLNVDDSEAGRYAKTRILQNAGYSVIEANNGTDALRLVCDVQPPLVLLDVMLPDANGLDICRKIKRDHPSTIVLQISATFTSPSHKAQGLAAGADSYLVEPVEPAELLANVQALLRLRDAEEELKQLNDSLEKRVTERTAELAAVNAQLLQSQKLEALGQLTGGLAHDFNNLLSAVLGNMRLVRKRCIDDAATVRLVDGAIEGALRGVSLTQRLLLFARRKDLQVKSVSLAALVRGMMDMLRRSIGAQIAIEVRLPHELWPTLVDPDQLELAMLNLALNARDAMPDGGTLTFSGSNEHLRSPQDELAAGDYVRLVVSDTGVGMDEATLARAVDPFFTTKGVGKGTGLGLSMIQGLAAQSGGVLRLRSRLGAGTSVELWLRRATTPATEAEAPRHAPAPAEPDTSTYVILVVEDDPLILMTAVAMLKDLGHEVLEAYSGRDALALLGGGKKVDVVVTDQGMPNMTGLQLAAAIREKWPDLPIILATGYAELPPSPQLDLPRLSKPYEQEELSTAISRAVRGRK